MFNLTNRTKYVKIYLSNCDNKKYNLWGQDNLVTCNKSF